MNNNIRVCTREELEEALEADEAEEEDSDEDELPVLTRSSKRLLRDASPPSKRGSPGAGRAGGVKGKERRAGPSSGPQAGHHAGGMSGGRGSRGERAFA